MGGKDTVEEGWQMKEARTLWTTTNIEGGRSSKTALFLSAQICQQVWAAKLGEEDFCEIQLEKQAMRVGPLQSTDREKD